MMDRSRTRQRSRGEGGSAGPTPFATAAWHVDARWDDSTHMTEQVNVITGLFSGLQAANVRSSSFSGTTLLGRMQLTGGTTHGTWLTDIDFTFTLPAVLPYAAVDADKVLTILAVPVVDTGGVDVWMELNLKLKTNGDILFKLDAGGGPSHIGWESASIGNWHTGMAGFTGRFTCVAATGAVTLYKDGVSIETGSIGAQTFNEPPNSTEVYAGSGTVLPVTSFTLKRSIGGATLFSFDASTPTGWVDADGDPTTAPTRAAYIGNDQAAGYFNSNAAFNVAANTDYSWVFALRPISTAGDLYVVHNGDGLGSDQAWGLLYIPPDIPFSFLISDAGGAHLVDASLGSLTRTDMVIFAILDRTAHTLKTYVNGSLIDTQDATGLGAVSPSVELFFGLNPSYIYAAAGYAHVLTGAERTAITATLGLA